MKIAFYTILYIVLFMLFGNTKIYFSPFHITMDRWYQPVAMTLLVASIVLLSLGSYRDGLKDGKKKAYNEIIEKLENKLNENNE